MPRKWRYSFSFAEARCAGKRNRIAAIYGDSVDSLAKKILAGSRFRDSFCLLAAKKSGRRQSKQSELVASQARLSVLDQVLRDTVLP
jgi:hypothetical protein